MDFGDLNIAAKVFVEIHQVLDDLYTEPILKGKLLILLFNLFLISFVDFSKLKILKDEFFGLMQTTYSTPSFDVYVSETLTNR